MSRSVACVPQSRPRALRAAGRLGVALLALVLAGCGVPPSSGEPAADPASPTAELTDGRTRVVLLGTGTPNADPQRSGPSLAVVVDDRAYIVDAGPGVVRRAAAAATLHALVALEPANLTHVFLSHLHSDHTVGLPDLMFTPWVLERDQPLTLIGPPGTQAMATHLSRAYAVDIGVRLGGLEPANAEGYRVSARDVEPGVVFEDDRVRVTAFSVPHATWEHAYGYRFDTPDRTIVVSGDTGPAAEVMARMCDGCDVLVHEAYAQVGWEKRDSVWQRYHAAAHTSGPELGLIARAARPRLLVLTHQLLWLGATPQDLLDEIAAEWDGPVVYGNDLEVY